MENRKRAGMIAGESHAPDVSESKAKQVRPKAALEEHPKSFHEKRNELIAKKAARKDVVKYLRELVESKCEESSSDED